MGRPLPDGRLYYLLHVKPSKFGRARVIPIGDQLGRAVAEIIQYVRAFYRSCEVPACDRRDEHEKRPLPRVPYLLQGRSYPARSIRIPARSIRTRSAGGCGCLRAPQQPHPVRVIQALLGHTTVTTCDDLRELHPSELVESYRRAMRGLCADVLRAGRNQPAERGGLGRVRGRLLTAGHGHPTSARCRPANTARAGWSASAAATPSRKKSAVPTLRRMLTSHSRALDRAREVGESAGQMAARELEVARIRSALQRAQETQRRRCGRAEGRRLLKGSGA